MIRNSYRTVGRLLTLTHRLCFWPAVAAFAGSVAAQNFGATHRPAPPPAPNVEPLISGGYSEDQNGDRIDDALGGASDAAEAQAKAALTVTEKAKAQALLGQRTEVELVFSQQITQEQIDGFLALGGEITYVYKAVSFGWNGRVPLGQVRSVAAKMGGTLRLIHQPKPIEKHMDTATRTGRVRPVWAPDFAGTGYSGSTNITIGIIDTGVDGTHTDLAGRQVYWNDFSGDGATNALDLDQHGSHVAGIALGTGAASGSAAGPLYFTQIGSLSGVSAGSFYPNPVDLPPASITYAMGARWNGGGSNTLHLVLHPHGTNGNWSSLGSITSFSPASLVRTFTANATNSYSPALLSGSGATDFVITNAIYNYPAFGDGFNRLRGVAPGCNWAGAKVFNNAGSASTAVIDSAIDDLVANRVAKNIKVINLSLGVGGRRGEDTVLRQKVNTAVNNGIVVVVSAGNSGTDSKPDIDDPGRAAMVLTVAAANDNNQLTDYTSHGFRNPSSTAGQEEDYKPDIMAPGGSTYYTEILSVDSNSGDGAAFPDQQTNDYFNISGTSMASPFAAGSAALVIGAMEQHGKTWNFSSSQSPRFVKMLLCATASESNANRENGNDNPTLQRAATGPLSFPAGKDPSEGYGMINPDAAVEAVSLVLPSGAVSTNTLGPSVTDRRVWARTLNLVSNQNLGLTLTVPSTGDFDLYLYSTNPSSYGDPVILASSTVAGNGATETISHMPAAAGQAIVVVKRISGYGMFTLNVSGNGAGPNNNPPTLAPLSNVTLNEDAGLQTVQLTGITPGPTNEATQTLSITAVSSNPGLTPDLTVNYTSPAPTGTLTFTPASNSNGVATINVIVKDNGGTTNGGVDSVTNTFIVTVTPVNDGPTLDAIASVTINANAGAQTVSLTGLSAGPANENGQTLVVTATSSSPSLIPNPLITYSNSSSTGALSFAPATNASGTATITVTVQDNGGTDLGGIDTTTQQFTVLVNPSADLALSVAADPSVAFGVSATIVLLVTNTGPCDADAVVASATLDATAALVSAMTTNGTWTNVDSIVTWNIGSLPSHASATLTINASPLRAGNLTNIATVVSSTTDPDGSNNVLTNAIAVLPRVSIGALTTAIPEDGGAQDVFTLQREGGVDGSLEVHYTVGGTAVPDRDYAPLPSSVVLSNGIDAVVIPVSPIHNFVADSNLTIVVTLAGDSGYAVQSTSNSAVVEIANVDVPGIVVSTNALSVTEGSSNTFAVRLSTKPSDDVVVSTSKSAGSTNLNVTAGATLTFNSSNWNIEQPVTIAAFKDRNTVNDEAWFVVSAAGLPSQTVAVTEVDVLQPPPLPVLLSQPLSYTVSPGTTVLLQVSATGALSYQWTLDNADLIDATNTAFAASAAGAYQVIVSNDGGSVTSAPAVLTFLSVSMDLNRFSKLRVEGPIGMQYQATWHTNLQMSNWLPLISFTLDKNPGFIIDTNLLPQKFYQVAPQP